jgi:beta-galactosidase
LNGAETLAEYNRQFYANTPAITRNAYNLGQAYYVGTELGPEMMRLFIEEVVNKSGVGHITHSPEGVEVTRRRGQDGEYIFVINHNNSEANVAISEKWHALVGGEHLQNKTLRMAPFGVALFHCPLG